MATPTMHPFRAADGYELAGDLHVAPSPRAVAVLAGGTGIPRRFYRAFAAYLAEEGYTTLSFDYRGIGGSRPPSLRGFDATMSDWGRRDIAAALTEARSLAGALPLVYVAHSVGGQLFGLAEGADRVTAAVFVGSSTGTWWQMGNLPFRLFCAAMWFGFTPVTTATLGYAPASWLRQGEDLPRGVAREWARWCRRASYFEGDLPDAELAGYGRLTMPIHSLGFTDDPIANDVTIPALLRHYHGASKTHEHLDPRDVGLSSVGHFGFFSTRSKHALWTKVPSLLRARVTRSQALGVSR